MTRSLFLAAVCGAAALLATAPLSVSGQATQADCDFYWSQVSWCQENSKWSATRIERCIEGMRRQTPQATYCPGPGLAPNNDRHTWEPLRLTIATEVQGQQLDLDAEANTVGVCLKLCTSVAKTAAAACQTIKCLGEATKAAAMCEKNCIVRPSSVTEEAESAASSVDAPAINTKCSVECQDKLARCKKAAGTDGVRAAQCLQPYNSCASACMRSAVPVAAQVTYTIEENDSQALGGVYDHMFDRTPCDQCSRQCDDSEPCLVACVAQCRSSSTSSIGETLTPRDVCHASCNHEYFECRDSLNPFKNRAWCEKDLDECKRNCPVDPW